MADRGARHRARPAALAARPRADRAGSAGLRRLWPLPGRGVVLRLAPDGLRDPGRRRGTGPRVRPGYAEPGPAGGRDRPDAAGCDGAARGAQPRSGGAGLHDRRRPAADARVRPGPGADQPAPDPWPAAEFGPPANQELMLGTLLDFTEVAWASMTRMGISLSEAEREANL